MVRNGGRALVLVAAMAAVASSSTVERMDPDQLTSRANVIFHGKCVEKKARERSDGAVVTDYQFDVYEFLKGAKGKTFSFTAYGGIIGDRGSAIAGAPQFQVDEEVLLFLDTINKAGCRQTIGLAQGKYSIRLVDGKKTAFRDLEGLKLLDPETKKVAEPKAEQGVPFDELTDRVKTRLKVGRQG